MAPSRSLRQKSRTASMVSSTKYYDDLRRSVVQLQPADQALSVQIATATPTHLHSTPTARTSEHLNFSGTTLGHLQDSASNSNEQSQRTGGSSPSTGATTSPNISIATSPTFTVVNEDTKGSDYLFSQDPRLIDLALSHTALQVLATMLVDESKTNAVVLGPKSPEVSLSGPCRIIKNVNGATIGVLREGTTLCQIIDLILLLPDLNLNMASPAATKGETTSLRNDDPTPTKNPVDPITVSTPPALGSQIAAPNQILADDAIPPLAASKNSKPLAKSGTAEHQRTRKAVTRRRIHDSLISLDNTKSKPESPPTATSTVAVDMAFAPPSPAPGIELDGEEEKGQRTLQAEGIEDGNWAVSDDVDRDDDIPTLERDEEDNSAVYHICDRLAALMLAETIQNVGSVNRSTNAVDGTISVTDAARHKVHAIMDSTYPIAGSFSWQDEMQDVQTVDEPMEGVDVAAVPMDVTDTALPTASDVALIGPLNDMLRAEEMMQRVLVTNSDKVITMEEGQQAESRVVMDTLQRSEEFDATLARMEDTQQYSVILTPSAMEDIEESLAPMDLSDGHEHRQPASTTSSSMVVAAPHVQAVIAATTVKPAILIASSAASGTVGPQIVGWTSTPNMASTPVPTSSVPASTVPANTELVAPVILPPSIPTGQRPERRNVRTRVNHTKPGQMDKFHPNTQYTVRGSAPPARFAVIEPSEDESSVMETDSEEVPANIQSVAGAPVPANSQAGPSTISTPLAIEGDNRHRKTQAFSPTSIVGRKRSREEALDSENEDNTRVSKRHKMTNISLDGTNQHEVDTSGDASLLIQLVGSNPETDVVVPSPTAQGNQGDIVSAPGTTIGSQTTVTAPAASLVSIGKRQRDDTPEDDRKMNEARGEPSAVAQDKIAKDQSASVRKGKVWPSGRR
ncbi:hypothetical protein FRB96_003982 [Tulasnella sp. 330]|nr:hypothetical protein FRB96_003982 [Tulasnella sp. 330]